MGVLGRVLIYDYNLLITDQDLTLDLHLLDRAAWGLVLHQQRPNMLLLIPNCYTTLSVLIFCLIRSQKANPYPLIQRYSRNRRPLSYSGTSA